MTETAIAPASSGATLSPEAEYEILMLKFLNQYGTADKLRADLSARAERDPSWIDVLDKWNSWYDKSEQAQANAVGTE